MVVPTQCPSNKVVSESFRPLDTPLDLIEDLSLGMTSLGESINLNENERELNSLSKKENKEMRRKLRM